MLTPLLLALAVAPQIAPEVAVELPTICPAGGKVDHGVVALNNQGDALVTWSSSIHPQGHPDQVLRRVEAVLLRRRGPERWIAFGPFTLGEGDDSLLPEGSIYPSGDICRKPDVVSLGNDFVVGWQRIARGPVGDARIEVAVVRPLPGAETEILSQASEGIGYVIDDFDATSSGGMLDLAQSSVRPGQVFAVFTHLTGSAPINGLEFAYDFEIRARGFEFDSSGNPPSLGGTQVLADGVAFDDFAPNLPGGGRVLPDAVFDAWGNVVLAFEEHRRADRPIGGGTADQTKIHLRRYEVDGGKTTEMDRQEFVGASVAGSFLRRPNLFRAAGSERIGMTWGQADAAETATDLRHFVVLYPGATGTPTLLDQNPTLIPGVPITLPVPMQFGQLDLVLAIGDAPAGRVAGWQRNSRNVWEEIKPFRGLRPFRPAADVLNRDPLRANQPLAVFCFETAAPGTEPRITCLFRPL